MSNFSNKKWKAQEMTVERAKRINVDVLRWLIGAELQARGKARIDPTQWGFEPDAAPFPKWTLADMLLARWKLKREMKEGNLKKDYKLMSERAMAALVAMRDLPRGLPLLVAGGRALAVSEVRTPGN